MIYLKIDNLLNQFGQPDYKGLDINQFVALSQVYAPDFSCCLVKTNQNITTVPTDVTELQEADYNTLKLQFPLGVTSTGTLPGAQNAKIAEITQEYENQIYGTFASTAFDGATEETYACDATSQMRINGEVTMAMAVKAGFSAEILSWKNANQAQCVTWTAEQMIKLGTDLHSFVTSKTDYLEQLTVYINSLTDINAVNAVTWGMTIPTA
jgi:hypothetical protein